MFKLNPLAPLNKATLMPLSQPTAPILKSSLDSTIAYAQLHLIITSKPGRLAPSRARHLAPSFLWLKSDLRLFHRQSIHETSRRSYAIRDFFSHFHKQTT